MKKSLLLIFAMLMVATVSFARATSHTYKGYVYYNTDASALYKSWELLPYDEETGKYEITVTVDASQTTFTLHNWTGETDSEKAEDIILGVDENGKVATINGKEYDEEDTYKESVWVTTGTVEDDGFYGVYAYPAYCAVTINEDGSGTGYINILSFGVTTDSYGAWRNVYFAWTTEEATDGISNVVADETNADAPIYTISGMKANKNVKGVYIQNGKKFVK